MTPADSLFNWKPSKDPKGTVKKELPRIVVTPPPHDTSSRPVVQRKKSKRPSKTRRRVDAPPELILDPDFWSHQPETQKRARKQRMQFTCRKPQCSEQFPSAWDRVMHEGFCLSFQQVFIFMYFQSQSNMSYRCPLVSSFILELYLLCDF